MTSIVDTELRSGFGLRIVDQEGLRMPRRRYGDGHPGEGARWSACSRGFATT